MTTIPRLLTLPEVAAVARAPLSSVRYWIQKGQLPSVKVGRRRLVAEADVVAFIGLPASATEHERAGLADSTPRRAPRTRSVSSARDVTG